MVVHSPDKVFNIKLIKDLAGKRSFDKGQDYYQRNKVKSLNFNPAEQSFTAQVIGREKYYTGIKISDKGVMSGCDCPMGKQGLFCKHKVALALKIINENLITQISQGQIEDTENDLDTLINQLDEDAKVILYIYSLYFKELNNTYLKHCIQKLQEESNLDFKRPIGQIQKELLAKGLLIEGQTYSIKPVYSFQIYLQAQKENYFHNMLGLVTKLFKTEENKNMKWGQLPHNFVESRLRLMLLTNDQEGFERYLDEYRYALNDRQIEELNFMLAIAIDPQTKLDWLDSRTPKLKTLIYKSIIHLHTNHIQMKPEFFDYLTKNDLTNFDIELWEGIIQVNILNGDLNKAKQQLSNFDTQYTANRVTQLSLQTVIELLENKTDQASKSFQAMLTINKKTGLELKSSRFYTIFFSCLIAKANLVEAKNLYMNSSTERLSNKLAQAFFLVHENKTDQAQYKLDSIYAVIENDENTIFNLDLLFLQLIEFYIDKDELQGITETLQNNLENISAQYSALSKSTYEILEYYGIKMKAQNYQEIKLNYLELIDESKANEYKLAELASLFKSLNKQKEPEYRTKRYIWLINPENKEVELKEQTMLKSGKWSAGKIQKDYRPYRLNESELLSTQDKEAIEYIKNCYYQYNYDKDKVLRKLVNAENLYNAKNPQEQIKLSFASVELEINEHNSPKPGYCFKLSHNISHELLLDSSDPQHWKLIEADEKLLAIKEIIGAQGLIVNQDQKDFIINMLKENKPDIKIVSDLDYQNLETIETDSRLYIRIFFDKDTYELKLGFYVKPHEQDPLKFFPGQGRRRICNNAANPIQCFRDFEQEENLFNELITDLELDKDKINSDYHYISTDIEASLDILEKLESKYETDNHNYVVEWQEDFKPKIKNNISSKNLSLNIQSQNHWFEFKGSLEIDEDLVLDISELIENNSLQRNFIKVGKDKFIRLNEQLKNSLQNLGYISSNSKHQRKVHNLAASTLEELSDSCKELSSDQDWKAHLEKISNFKKFKPKASKNFTGDLRHYQEDGFKWLSRLAYLGAGACLADDMGLGKTIQAISVLSNQVKSGPVLIIAPSSLVYNWETEINKFSTKIKSFVLSNYRPEDRESLVNKIKKNQVLITTYGLLQQNPNLYTEHQWSMLVLDESQAIKNPNTKRSKAAKAIDADFKLVLSGTPIENNLSELWSQFDFINPGLLGSLESFRSKYANAIEVNQDPKAKSALKSLIQPYILRRNKSEVLQELPPKIENTIKIEFSKHEAAFYEALRKKAIENIENLEDKKNKKFQILSEMTKLRRACCAPSLAGAPSKISSSKNQEFISLVESIIENKHKALVFSQYTSYLDLIKQDLDQLSIKYLYLDGSTPTNKRKKLVDEFQEGDTQIFLLSLKAGGSGLNLTAADYVIHLDPWWNPAVEDQASDRAHRIGQKKTVNVYRLIVKNSIEDKILEMHDKKRELSNELLSDTDMTAKLSEKELLDMITA